MWISKNYCWYSKDDDFVHISTRFGLQLLSQFASVTHLLFCATSENTCLVDLFSDHMILLLIVGIVTNYHIIPINQDFIHSICFLRINWVKHQLISSSFIFPFFTTPDDPNWSIQPPRMNPLTGTSTAYGTTQHLPASATYGRRWSTWPGRRVWVLYLDMTH